MKHPEVSPVLFEEIPCRNGKVIAVSTLNVEKTLNSLSLEMIDLLFSRLTQWQDDDRIALVVFQGAGDRAFCAGGDIQALYRSMVEHPGGPNPYAEAFFEREYRLDYLMHTYGKPLMVWGHGIVMGGGLGIFGGCSHRIATENSRIALPEITIGLFPDAGASVFLGKMPSHLAHFMALTGCQINARDALLVGLADHLIAHREKAALLTALTEEDWGDSAAENAIKLTGMLVTFEKGEEFPASRLQGHGEEIKVLFSGSGDDNFLGEFSRGLLAITTEDQWLQRAVKTFRSGCPTTAHIVVEQLRRIQNLSLHQMFEMELTIAVQCSRHPDFTEGVRALLIDKDNRPGWQFPTGEVPQDWVEEHFEEPWASGNPLADLVPSGAAS